MARIVVIEPHVEVRDLLLRVAGRLGHEAVAYETEADLASADVVLVEPAAPGSLEAAQAARELGAPIVCISIFPASDETRALDPVAHLHKPFALVDLEHALVGALARRKPLTAA